MNITIGDVVTHISKKDKFVGIVISQQHSNNDSFTASQHTQHLVNAFPFTYYILWNKGGVMGPYYSFELISL